MDNAQIDDKEQVKKQEESFKHKGWSRFHITIEPIKFANSLSMAFTSGIFINYLESYICHRSYSFSSAKCNNSDLIGIDTSVSGDETTATIRMLMNLIEILFPLFICIYVGPWSDINGRKPFVIIPTLGYSIYYFLWGIMSLTTILPVYVYIIPSLILSMSGGLVSMNISYFSYISDNFSPEVRAQRFSILQVIGITAVLAGNALSTVIFYHFGSYAYQIIFFSSSAILGLAFIYEIVFLEETLERKEGQITKLFDLSLLKSVVNVLIVGPKNRRLMLYLILAVLTGDITANSGDQNIVYLVGRNQFHWSLKEYNIFSGVITLFSACSNTCGVWIFKNMLGLSNKPIIAILVLVLTSMEVLRGLSTNDILYLISASVISMCTVLGVFVDDELYDSVSGNDSGKVGSIYAIIECLSALIAAPMYVELYNFLLTDRPSFVFFLSGAIFFLSFLASLAMIICDIKRKDPFSVIT